MKKELSAQEAQERDIETLFGMVKKAQDNGFVVEISQVEGGVATHSAHPDDAKAYVDLSVRFHKSLGLGSYQSNTSHIEQEARRLCGLITGYFDERTMDDYRFTGNVCPPEGVPAASPGVEADLQRLMPQMGVYDYDDEEEDEEDEE